VDPEPGRSLAGATVDDRLAHVNGGHFGEVEVARIIDVAFEFDGSGRQRRGLVDPAPAAARGAPAEGGDAETVAGADGRAAETGEIVVAGSVPSFGRVDAETGVRGLIVLGQVGHASLSGQGDEL
jgi:hypothetical protein